MTFKSKRAKIQINSSRFKATVWLIQYDSYHISHVIHFIWSISNDSYDMVHITSIILNAYLNYNPELALHTYFVVDPWEISCQTRFHMIICLPQYFWAHRHPQCFWVHLEPFGKTALQVRINAPWIQIPTHQLIQEGLMISQNIVLVGRE